MLKEHCFIKKKILKKNRSIGRFLMSIAILTNLQEIRLSQLLINQHRHLFIVDCITEEKINELALTQLKFNYFFVFIFFFIK